MRMQVEQMVDPLGMARDLGGKGRFGERSFANTYCQRPEFVMHGGIAPPNCIVQGLSHRPRGLQPGKVQMDVQTIQDVSRIGVSAD